MLQLPNVVNHDKSADGSSKKGRKRASKDGDFQQTWELWKRRKNSTVGYDSYT